MPEESSQTSPQAAALRSGRWVTFLIVSVGLLALASFSLLKISAGPSLRLKTCFQDVRRKWSSSRGEGTAGWG
jgi:hypothetical protein